jgi:hypothetical protein
VFPFQEFELQGRDCPSAGWLVTNNDRVFVGYCPCRIIIPTAVDRLIVCDDCFNKVPPGNQSVRTVCIDGSNPANFGNTAQHQPSTNKFIISQSGTDFCRILQCFDMEFLSAIENKSIFKYHFKTYECFPRRFQLPGEKVGAISFPKNLQPVFPTAQGT